MAIAVIELLGSEVSDTEFIKKKITSGDDAIYHESEVVVHDVLDESLKTIIQDWIKEGAK